MAEDKWNRQGTRTHISLAAMDTSVAVRTANGLNRTGLDQNDIFVLEKIVTSAYEARKSKPEDILDTERVYQAKFAGCYAYPTQETMRMEFSMCADDVKRRIRRIKNPVLVTHLEFKVGLDEALLELKKFLSATGAKTSLGVRPVLELYRQAGKKVREAVGKNEATYVQYAPFTNTWQAFVEAYNTLVPIARRE